MKITTCRLLIVLLFNLANGSTVGKRDIFSPHDTKDTPLTFSKSDLRDVKSLSSLPPLEPSERLPASFPTLPANSQRSNNIQSNIHQLNTLQSNRPQSKILIPTPTDRPTSGLTSSIVIRPPNPLRIPDPILDDPKPDNRVLGKSSNEYDPSLFYFYHPNKYENRDSSSGYSSSYQPQYNHLESSGYGGSGGYGFFDMNGDHTRGIFKVALPLFVLGGLLFGLSHLASSFTARSLDESYSWISEMEKEVEEIFQNYLNVLDSDQCLKRIICEAGYVTSDYSIIKTLLRYSDLFLPEAMQSNLEVFKSSALHSKKSAKCSQYACDVISGKKRKRSKI